MLNTEETLSPVTGVQVETYSKNNVFSLGADVAGGRVSCNCDEVGSAGIG